MSAIDQMRASLDQLMGTTRDGESNKFKLRFDDPRVCRSFLLGCCPHEILSSTRLNLGECPKIHDLAFKADYKNAYVAKRVNYDIDAYEHLAAFLDDCDKRTEIAKRKLKETQEELSKEAAANADKIFDLGEQIGKTLAEAETLGAEGNVEQSMLLLEKVEELKKEKLQAEADFRNSMPASSHQQQKLRMCEVCCAFLGIHDNDRQLADHFEGKLHLGFIAIRQKIEELKARIEKDQAERESRDSDTDRRRRDDKVERRDNRRSSSRSKSSRSRRSRSRSRGYRSSRDRRSRSRDRDRRSRSRERRSRSRERNRDRHHRNQRSRSRDRVRRRSRSTSKDRKQKRSRSRSESRSHKNSRRSRSSSRKRSDRSTGSKQRSRSPSKIKDADKLNKSSLSNAEYNSDVCIDTTEPYHDANDTNDSIPEDGEVNENGD